MVFNNWSQNGLELLILVGRLLLALFHECILSQFWKKKIYLEYNQYKFLRGFLKAADIKDIHNNWTLKEKRDLF